MRTEAKEIESELAEIRRALGLPPANRDVIECYRAAVALKAAGGHMTATRDGFITIYNCGQTTTSFARGAARDLIRRDLASFNF